MSSAIDAPVSILRRPRRWFAIDGPVSRQDYVQLGWTLAIVKYAIESSAIAALTGEFYTPLAFLNPWLNTKAGFLDASSGWALAWFVFTIPFVWIAISMSIRRAADAGRSPWWGMAILVPMVNYLVMIALSLADSEEQRRRDDAVIAEARQRSAFAPPADIGDGVAIGPRGDGSGSFLIALLVGVLIQVGLGLISVWFFREYGLILFFTTPFFAGAASGAVLNLDRRRGIGQLVLLIVMMNLASFIAMLCVGIDGAVCLFMAFPLLAPMSFFGGIAGSVIMTANLRGRDERKGLYTSLILLPIALLLEPLDSRRELHRVDTTVVINAPTTEVWNVVVAFPEITETPAWFFRAGISAPIRARIEGTGVGACRYCEFTTGPFVEPITVWDQPTTTDPQGKLAFDVRSQPLPMEEWTPFSGLHPPHLDDGFVSRRGQFLLEPLPGNRTRLTGTTWYDIDVRPRMYWQIWATPTIHAIHQRVLNHIKRQCEANLSRTDVSRTRSDRENSSS